MLVVYRIQNSILSKIKYDLFFINTLVIECCQIVGNNTAYRHLYGHLIIYLSINETIEIDTEVGRLDAVKPCKLYLDSGQATLEILKR